MPDSATTLDDGDLGRLLSLVREHTGISMDESKRQLVAGRLGRRVRRLGLASFRQYADVVSEPGSPELQSFINAVTTNLTAFFREPHHFEHLREVTLPRIVAGSRERRLRIWSAGCSTGPEPYSIAMVVADVLANHPGWDWKVLATDLDSDVLARAAVGIYDDAQVEAVPETLRVRHMRRGRGHNAGKVRIHPRLREHITFRQLNLMGAWPMHGPFDAIFCRNVAIYFDKPTQTRLFERLAGLMLPGNPLYIGHSESLHCVTGRFDLQGQTIYRRV